MICFSNVARNWWQVCAKNQRSFHESILYVVRVGLPSLALLFVLLFWSCCGWSSLGGCLRMMTSACQGFEGLALDCVHWVLGYLFKKHILFIGLEFMVGSYQKFEGLGLGYVHLRLGSQICCHFLHYWTILEATQLGKGKLVVAMGSLGSLGPSLYHWMHTFSTQNIL